MHEGAQGEPEAIEDAEVVGHFLFAVRFRQMQLVPLFGVEAADHEEHHADAQVSEGDAHPDLVGQRLHEAEDVLGGAFGLLEHDAQANFHERRREVDNALSRRGDGEGGDGDIGVL